MDTRDLINYQKNINSQGGEDGVIEEICKRLKIKNGNFVEFGAWDGKYLSNTYKLLSENWKGVYIEGEESKYQDLLKTKSEFPDQVFCICSFVTEEGGNSLDHLLSQTPLPKDFELLSIDIDSYDFHVWRGFQDYNPKIVIIEGNSMIAPGIWQIHEEGLSQGSSFTALLALGEQKGYKLVCHTGNLIFVQEQVVPELKLNPLHLEFPETLFNYKRHYKEIEYESKLTTKIRKKIPMKIKRFLTFGRI